MPEDTHPYNFKIYLKDSEIEFLQKHDFSKDIPISILSDDESFVVAELAGKGILRSHPTYIQGTLLYTQLIQQLDGQ
jgi:hypothetical protein